MNYKEACRETDTHIFFFGGCYSQWSPIGFIAPLLEIGGDDEIKSTNVWMNFNCAEQYMMANKASIFGDHETLKEIMNKSNPRDQKALGRDVTPFDKNVWEGNARRIVFLGSWFKFTSSENWTNKIINTGTKTLVEGSPYDSIWGVKISWNSPAIENERNWKGTNWLGICLMAMRDSYRRNPNADPIALANSLCELSSESKSVYPII